MTRTARLSADLVANTTGFESSLKRASRSVSQAKQSWNNDLNRAGRSFSKFDGQVRSSLGSIVDLRTQLGGIAVATASALSVGKIIRYSDTWKQLEGRLGIISNNMNEVVQSQKALFEIAQRTRQPLEGITSFYTRLNQFIPESERKSYDLLKVTESVSAALAITGETGASAQAAMIQFTQAIGTNFEAAGQEIRSLQEQAPRLTLALVNGIGDGTKSLKQLKEEGLLTRQSVLSALSDMGGEAGKLAEELANIPTTVGQALTRLDNAFLQFIGQTDAIRSGTSSLAVGITALANNFGLLAKAVTGVAVVIGVRLVSSLAAATTAATATALSTLRVQVALAGMAGTSRIAAVSLLGLSGAMSAVGGAMALLGGPIGVAIIGTLVLMRNATNGAKDAQEALNNAMGDHRQFVNEYIRASDDRRAVIQENTKANINSYKQELIALEKIAQTLDNENGLFKLSRKLGSKIGIDTTADDVREVAKDVRSAIDELERDLEFFDKNRNAPRGVGGTGTGTGSKGKSKTDVAADLIENLKNESEQLQIQIDMYGQKEAAIDKAQKAAEIRNKLEEKGITLTEKQQAQLDQYLETIEKQTELQKEQADVQERLEEKERNRREALDQLGATFESAFEKAISEGEKLSDVLDALLDDILKLLTRITITEPLGNALGDLFGDIGGGGGSSSGGSSSGGGFLSSIASFAGSLFSGGSGVPALAVGTNNVPQDMFAQIHKGEMVIPAYDANKLRNGGMGGGANVQVIVNNNTDSSVSTSSQETGDGAQLNIMIDQAVADNINKPGTRTNQALNSMNSRTRVRR